MRVTLLSATRQNSGELVCVKWTVPLAVASTSAQLLQLVLTQLYNLLLLYLHTPSLLFSLTLLHAPLASFIPVPFPHSFFL